MSFAGMPQVFDLDPHKISEDPAHVPGLLAIDRFGDLYRYVQAGASNISAGKLQIAPAPKTNHHNVAWASGGAIGSNKVTVTLGATAAVANEYAGGILSVNDATGEGSTYRISGHPAADSAGTLEVTIYGSFYEALVSGSEVTLTHNTFNGVVEGTDEERLPAGIPSIDITATYWGWAKTHGQSAALADETLNLGALLTIGTSTAGAVEEMDDLTTNITDIAIGYAHVAGVDTEYRPIMLTID